MVNLNELADKVVSELLSNGIECYVYHRATTGSVYIRFKDQRMCSIRLGDHNGRGKLKYKYNIRVDLPLGYNKWQKDGDIWRLFLSSDQWKEIVPVLLKRKDEVKLWSTTKYSYKTPSFKK